MRLLVLGAEESAAISAHGSTPPVAMSRFWCVRHAAVLCKNGLKVFSPHGICISSQC